MKIRLLIHLIIVILLAFLFYTSSSGFTKNRHAFYVSADENIRVMTYNIRGARGEQGRIELDRIAGEILHSGADIVALQEVDFHLPRSNFTNQPSYLAGRLLMNYTYHPNIHFIIGSYGLAILSRFPIVGTEYFRLPGNSWESRGLLKATINTGEQMIEVYSTHLSLKKEERIEQMAFIRERIKSNHHPYLIVLGDFNAFPSHEHLNSLRELLIDPVFENNLNLYTYHTLSHSYQIDYILYSPAFSLQEAGTFSSSSSDHDPLIYSIEVIEPQTLQAGTHK